MIGAFSHTHKQTNRLLVVRTISEEVSARVYFKNCLHELANPSNTIPANNIQLHSRHYIIANQSNHLSPLYRNHSREGVAEGISTLPGQPELVIVEAVSPSTLKVSWQKASDESELRKLDGWIINLTKLSSFEDTIAGGSRTSASSTPRSSGQSSASSSLISSSFSSSTSLASNDKATPLANLTIVDVMNNSSLTAMTKLLAASSGTISLKLDKQSSEFSIDNLKPYTVYQIQMFAYNSKGRSQLTDPIRALTLAPESELTGGNAADAYVEPNLPDTRKCCVDRGVTLKR